MKNLDSFRKVFVLYVKDLKRNAVCQRSEKKIIRDAT